MSQDPKQAATRPLSLLQTVRAIAWAFFGVRKSAGYQADITRLNPRHVIVAGVVAALLFVLALVTVVRWVIGSGIAT